MFGSAARVLAAVVLSVGLVCLPHAGPADAAAKSKKTSTAKKDDKKSSKKKTDSKKSSKTKAASSKKDKKSSKRSKEKASSSKTAKRSSSRESSSSKRAKNEDREVSSRDERLRRDRQVRAAATAETLVEDDAEAEEPVGPRPANRLVADIPTHRVVEIQNALIKEGLMTGPPSGVYDQVTFNAMSAFQVRKGLTGVGVPTATSLKELGVRKNSGYGLSTPTRVVETTAP